MVSKVKFALFGFGNMGLSHMKNILTSPRASVKWVVRNKIKEAQKFVQDYSLAARCTTPDNLEGLYNDPEVNAVLICSPTSTHEPLIRDSLLAGKAVFCEKPITDDLSSTAACYDLAEKQKKPLFNAMHRRYEPNFRSVREKIMMNELGNLRLIKLTSRDLSPPPISYIKTSGGIIYDSTVHDLDMSLWLAGSKPESVYVSASAFDPEIASCGDFDQVVVTIKFRNGVISSVENGRVAPYGYDQRLEVLCDKGMISVDNKRSSLVTEHLAKVTTSPPIDDHFINRYPQAYAAELEHFLDVMQEKAELQVKKEDTLNVMRLIQACQQSIATKGPVAMESEV
ncbi:inositol 2-dehydrogenase-like [Ostrea edulis]|uniref:inositol 2-dehydrogenase-like n=1 Tax=Ostrea edulis TaxID=37623 RepID=UPI0024AF9D04|nr:inositol 2-dehydrogenase-like [Ostrea edulis]XP_048747074.2 inositol 2-dehydrogenase-like [Ostrea edulis]